ncbi:MAG: phosphoribosyltransferase [Candidatus Methanomethyliaceae archaeon]|nr:phosphoribosyltransferase [Candidatus Methanomethyliaceae archaeon]
MHSSLLTLANKISESNFTPEMIVGIARGGWVVARILSDLLNVRDLASLKIEFYKAIGEKDRKPRITQPVSESPAGKLVLIADDVADTGESLMLAKEHISSQGAKETKVATIHYKPWSKMKPDYYASLTDAWIIYPWEIRETIENLIKIWREETKDPLELRSRLASTGLPLELIDRYFFQKNAQR